MTKKGHREMKVSQRNTARPVERPRLDGRVFVCYDLCKHRHKPSPLCFFLAHFFPLLRGSHLRLIACVSTTAGPGTGAK